MSDHLAGLLYPCSDSRISLQTCIFAVTVFWGSRYYLASLPQEDEIPLGKVVGFTSDGASVMVGEHKGVATLLKKDCPAALTFHCAAHKLALSCSDLFKDEAELQQLDNIITKVYGYFKNSSLRRGGLKRLQKLMKSKEYKVLKLHT